jgi:hypothetical protein
MTQDPIQPLADVGRRVLQTVRYLATPPVPDQPLASYESLVRNPVVTMSGICNELLERLATAPVAAKPEDLPHEPWSRFVPDSNASPTSPILSSAGAVATRFPVKGYYQAADSWTSRVPPNQGRQPRQSLAEQRGQRTARRCRHSGRR